MFLQVGTPAPDFMLPDKDGNPVSLSDFRGKKVVLYFYPKDNTPGCTRQACAFAARYEGFKAKNVAVIGISKDSVVSHQRFAEKHCLRRELSPGKRHKGRQHAQRGVFNWQEHGPVTEPLVRCKGGADQGDRHGDQRRQREKQDQLIDNKPLKLHSLILSAPLSAP